MELNCPVKDYHWGKKGSCSLVAQLKLSSDRSFTIDNRKTYAELWMGVHPSGPALIKESNILLGSWLKSNLSAIGDECRRTFGSDLPYLFKVLSINMPLSIQVHPSKTEAEKLHEIQPEVYKDANHKPELAIALNNFESLCGFRPIEEIKYYFNLIPELKEVIGEPNVKDFLNSNEDNAKENLKKCFWSLMSADEFDIKSQMETLLKRLTETGDLIKQQTQYFIADQETRDKSLTTLLKKIHTCFPGDVGCFCIYFLNYLVLKPGEAIFLGDGEPHSYISGDCIECMACSDNVVRAGLTPKQRDIETLCRILNYSSHTSKSKLLLPTKENDSSSVYRPPTREFAVCRIKILPNEEYHLIARKSASICIVIEGSGYFNKNLPLSKGSIFFISAEEICSIQVSSCIEPFLLFQAFVNI